MNSKAIIAVCTVLLGCGLNNVFLEYIIKLDPGAGHLITFLQFLFIAAHGFIFTSKFGSVEPKIARKNYLTLVIFFFATSVMNNWAFNFNIAVPLHMIFRAGSLIANMIMGIWILKKKYTWDKFLSVTMITLGIIICTLCSSQKTPEPCKNCNQGPNFEQDLKEDLIGAAEAEHFFWWVVGIIILTTALLLSARMGIYQESIYKVYGKHPSEALYYTHLYSLPGFMFYAPSILDHMGKANQSEMYAVPFVDISLPIIWVFLILNVLTQYLCISSVYVLTTECTSLTVTLVITLRKFLSLIFSIVYFKNPFTIAHWFGTALVFIGTLIFTEVIQRLVISSSDKHKKTN